MSWLWSNEGTEAIKKSFKTKSNKAEVLGFFFQDDSLAFISLPSLKTIPPLPPPPREGGGANVVPHGEIKSIIRSCERSQGLAVRWRTASGMDPKSLLSKDFCIALCYTLITDVLLLSLQHHYFLFPSRSARGTNTFTVLIKQRAEKHTNKKSIKETLLFLVSYIHTWSRRLIRAAKTCSCWNFSYVQQLTEFLLLSLFIHYTWGQGRTCPPRFSKSQFFLLLLQFYSLSNSSNLLKKASLFSRYKTEDADFLSIALGSVCQATIKLPTSLMVEPDGSPFCLRNSGLKIHSRCLFFFENKNQYIYILSCRRRCDPVGCVSTAGPPDAHGAFYRSKHGHRNWTSIKAQAAKGSVHDARIDVW